jgi:hypothetical protein
MSSLQDETPNKRSLLIKMDPRKKEKKKRGAKFKDEKDDLPSRACKAPKKKEEKK